MLLWVHPIVQTLTAVGEAENAAQTPTLPVKAVSDTAIEKRLRTVIENIDDFQNVKIDVNSGVVRLSGTTTRKETSEKVEQMVTRFEGVIYVDNQIQVESDVEDRVKPAITRSKAISDKCDAETSDHRSGACRDDSLPADFTPCAALGPSLSTVGLERALAPLPQSRKSRRASESRGQG
ncbi:MAG: BON domain-containing protein [Desulfobacterales bacterium]